MRQITPIQVIKQIHLTHMIMPVHETILNSIVATAGSFLFGVWIKIVFNILLRNWVAVATDDDFGDVSKFALDLDAVETDGKVRVADGKGQATVFYVPLEGLWVAVLALVSVVFLQF
jgi:hypothetical protein